MARENDDGPKRVKKAHCKQDGDNQICTEDRMTEGVKEVYFERE